MHRLQFERSALERESEIVRIEGGSHYPSFDSGQSSVPPIVTATDRDASASG